MKRILFILFILLFTPSALALQQVAGQLLISVPVGGSNSALYGLVNDGNETITISIRADGDAAQYLSFPASVELVPNKIVYASITAAIPSNYNSGNTISGSVYALQQGKPGQVQINVQMKKSLTITVTNQPSSAPANSTPSSAGSSGTAATPTKNTTAAQQPQQNNPDQPDNTEPTGLGEQQPAAEPLQAGLPSTGFAAAFPADLATGAAIAAIIVIILVAFAILKKLGKI